MTRPLRDNEIHVRPITAGGVLSVLAEYLGRAIHAETLRRSPLGKPYIRGADLEFSVSHTQGCGVIAIARRALGIDVEALLPLPDLESLAAVSLAAGEARALAAMPATEREDWYYRCWVRKEALLKARGCGLTLDPRAIDTTRAADGWHWHDVRLAGRIAMSIATPYPRVRIVTMDGLR